MLTHLAFRLYASVALCLHGCGRGRATLRFMFGKHIHVHVHVDFPEPDWARQMSHQLEKIKENTETIMASQEEFNSVLGRIDVATNDIAADVRGLKDKIAELLANAGLSGAEENAILAGLEAVAVRSEALASDTENPVPDPEPEPDPEPTPEPDPGEAPSGRNR